MPQLKLKLKLRLKLKLKLMLKLKLKLKLRFKLKLRKPTSKAKFESQTRHNRGTPGQTQRGNCAEMALSFLKQNLKPGAHEHNG